jgi:LuxR family maltose regulon positive regulatory protein
MLHARGIADLLQGDLGGADVLFARALDEAVSAGVVPFVPVVLATRGLVALERDEQRETESLAAEALAITVDHGLGDYWTSALPFAFGASVASRRGDVAQARELAARVARLRPLLTHAIPIVAVLALLELTRAYIAVGDAAGARAVLRQINDIEQHRPDLGSLHDQAGELRRKVEDLRIDMLGASALSAAELRLLPLLPTHLSFAEISERLFLSRNTIKSQAMSIYRKLGVSTRSETIARLYELGLVAHP